MVGAPVGAGEETEDSDTVVIPRTLDKGKGKEPVARFTLHPSAIPSPPKHKEGVKMVIGDKKNPSISPERPPVENNNSEGEAKPLPVKKIIGKIGKISGKKATKNENGGDAEMKDPANTEPSGSSTPLVIDLYRSSSALAIK